MKKTIKNISIDFYRKNKKEREHMMMSPGCYENISDERTELEFNSIEEDGELKKVLKGLSDKYKEIFMMRCMQDMLFAEIAMVVEEKPATVRKQYERARKMIKENMKEGGNYGYKKKAL